MKKIIILLILSSILFLMIGCDDLTSEKRFTKDKYIVTGLLINGKGIDMSQPVMISKTADVDGGSIYDMAIDSALVKIIDNTSKTEYELTFGIDPEHQKIGYYDASNTFIAEAGKTYQLHITVGSEIVTAETTVPPSIQVMDNPGYSFQDVMPYNTMVYDLIDIDYRLRIETFRPENINLFVEYYCLDEWNEVEWAIDFPGATDPEDADDYENMLDGSPRRSYGYYTYKPIIEDGHYLIDIGFNQLSYNFYGNYRVTVQSVDQNYYSYLYKPEGYRFGGIQNGYGYFGSASSQNIWTKIIK